MTDTSHQGNKFLFVSDAHLGGFSEEKNRAIEQSLVNLVDFCQREGYQLAILGDLFDYWMEYPDYIPPLGKRLLHRLEKYNHNFGPALYITGNHDNWTDGYFASLGFDVESEYRKLKIDGSNLLALHGDGIPDESMNLKRPLLHRLLRNKRFVAFYRTILPPRAGLSVMRTFSRLTRSAEEHRMEEETLNNWARQHLEQSETNIIICGHDHIPRKKIFDSGTFINPGAFYKDRTIAIYNKGHFDLVVWRDKLRQTEPFNFGRFNE